MKKILSILFVLILCLGMFTACTGGDDDGADVEYPITVKIAHTDSSSRSTHVWAEWLGEYLEEKAPGHFNVEVYSDGSLGDTPDAIAGLGLGTLQMTFDLASCFTQVAGDASACIDLPYLYPS